MIKFLHGADLHLDFPFRALPPEQAALRRREQLGLLRDLVDLANDTACDLVLLSGDLLDSEAARPDTADALRRSLAACRAPVFIAPGNHDYFAPGSPYAAAGWPENVHIFTRETPEAVTLEALGVRVWGAAFTSPVAPAPAPFQVPNDGLWDVMVLHGDLSSGPYRSLPLDWIAATGLDYLALGHIHKASGLLHAGKTAYAFPGCPMGRGFDETGPKGVYIGTLSQEGCHLDFHPLPGRRYEILTVEAGDDPLSAILTALPEDSAEHIYRIRLTGPSDPVDPAALEAALRERTFAVTLRDETTPRRDLWAACGDDSLKGLFLSALKDRRDEDPNLCDLAARLGTAALEGWEVLP